ncbi:MAG: Tropinone reductase 1 [Myxococcota bacterium]|jgi:Tropinone reductase 1
MSADPWRLDGCTALVTGGTKGIGAAIVAELVERGAQVVVVARGEAGLAALQERHPSIMPIAADLGDADDRARVADGVRGPLHVLVNNVGTNVRKPTADLEPPEWEALMQVNAASAWDLCRRLHPNLRDAGGASVVNVSSVAAERAVRTSTAVYAMSKGAMHGLTRFLAAEWGPDQIRVNAVLPWYVRTPLVEPVLRDPAKVRAILDRTPLGRIGEPEDVARAVAFLAVPASSWITGAELPVDGGFLVLGS